jgi:hypothetical protein
MNVDLKHVAWKRRLFSVSGAVYLQTGKPVLNMRVGCCPLPGKSFFYKHSLGKVAFNRRSNSFDLPSYFLLV